VLADTATQETISIREAAERLGCSEKRVRRLVKAGTLRAQMTRGRYGPEYRIETAYLPLPEALDALPRAGEATRNRGGEARASEALVQELQEMRERYGQAMVEVGRLGAADAERKMLAERAESLLEAKARAEGEAEAERRRAGELAEREAAARAESDAQRQRAEQLAQAEAEAKEQAAQLAGEVDRLRVSVRWRSVTAGIGVLAAIVAIALAFLR
jgi:excisionase family DNA binding protein